MADQVDLWLHDESSAKQAHYQKGLEIPVRSIFSRYLHLQLQHLQPHTADVLSAGLCIDNMALQDWEQNEVLSRSLLQVKTQYS